MSYDETTAIRAILSELRQLYYALAARLGDKRQELFAIEYQLRGMGWPGIATLTLFGQAMEELITGKKVDPKLLTLLQRRETLRQEIELERRELLELSTQIAEMQRRLVQKTMEQYMGRRLQEVPTDLEERKRRMTEIEMLYRILFDPRAPPWQKELAKKRLRDLGEPV